jgi:hypothetical protein
MSKLTADEWNSCMPVGTLVRWDDGLGTGPVTARTAGPALPFEYTTGWWVELEGNPGFRFSGRAIEVVQEEPTVEVAASELRRLAEAVEALTETLRELLD